MREITSDDFFNAIYDVAYSCEKVDQGIGGVKNEDEIKKRFEELIAAIRN